MIVLIICADDSSRRANSRLLRALGHSYIEAKNGDSGITTYLEYANNIGMVLVDLVLDSPIPDGLDVIRGIRSTVEDERRIVRVPICLRLYEDDTATITKALDYGADSVWIWNTGAEALVEALAMADQLNSGKLG